MRRASALAPTPTPPTWKPTTPWPSTPTSIASRASLQRRLLVWPLHQRIPPPHPPGRGSSPARSPPRRRPLARILGFVTGRISSLDGFRHSGRIPLGVRHSGRSPTWISSFWTHPTWSSSFWTKSPLEFVILDEVQNLRSCLSPPALLTLPRRYRAP